jgi:hypothetical protein
MSRLGPLADRVHDPAADPQFDSLLDNPAMKALLAPRMVTHGLTSVRAYFADLLRYTNAGTVSQISCPTFVTDNETAAWRSLYPRRTPPDQARPPRCAPSRTCCAPTESGSSRWPRPRLRRTCSAGTRGAGGEPAQVPLRVDDRAVRRPAARHAAARPAYTRQMTSVLARRGHLAGGAELLPGRQPAGESEPLEAELARRGRPGQGRNGRPERSGAEPGTRSQGRPLQQAQKPCQPSARLPSVSPPYRPQP